MERAYASQREFAWSRADAVDVIAAVERSGLTVLGVEIWIPSPDGPIRPTPFVYDWGSDDWKRYAPVPKSAAEYVRSFEWDPADVGFKNREPYFNLTVDDAPN
jgi:hypothetical protein